MNDQFLAGVSDGQKLNLNVLISDVNKFPKQTAKPNTLENVKLRGNVKVRRGKSALKFLTRLVNKLK
jgi:hypothetical protein